HLPCAAKNYYPVTGILQKQWWVSDEILAYLFMSLSIIFALFRRIVADTIRLLYAVALAGGLLSCVAETLFAQSVTPSVVSVDRDLNGDGYSDLIWRNMVTGDVAVSLTGQSGSISRSTLVPGLDLNWQIAGVGDLDGDGKADLVWRNNYSGDVVA